MNMEKGKSSRTRKQAILMGILCVVAGIIAMASPALTGVLVTSLIGAMLLATGILELASAFWAGGWRAGAFAFVAGLLAVLAGGAILARPVLGASIFSIMLIGFFMADGIARSILAFRVKPLPGWGIQLLGGLASIVLGFLIWRDWPLSGLWAIGTLLGIRMLFTGFALFAMAPKADQE